MPQENTSTMYLLRMVVVISFSWPARLPPPPLRTLMAMGVSWYIDLYTVPNAPLSTTSFSSSTMSLPRNRTTSGARSSAGRTVATASRLPAVAVGAPAPGMPGGS